MQYLGKSMESIIQSEVGGVNYGNLPEKKVRNRKKYVGSTINELKVEKQTN